MRPEMRRSVANEKKVLENLLELGFLDPIPIILVLDLENVFVLNCALNLHNFE